jgi:hypothetical protein
LKKLVAHWHIHFPFSICQFGMRFFTGTNLNILPAVPLGPMADNANT